MDDRSYHMRVPNGWVRTALIVGATALIVAPLTAVAAHVFNDVPESHTFHNDITWLADAGVTRGCNPPDNTEYCPDDNVTRGQMAAFMKRFAGYIDAEDGTPAQADNANKVDGQDAEDMTVIVKADIDSSRGGEQAMAEVVPINEVTIDAPVPGVLVLNGSVFINNDDSDIIGLTPFVDGSRVGSYGALDYMSAADEDADSIETLSYTTAVEVSAGEHLVRQMVGGLDDDGNLIANAFLYNANNLTVTFIPNGSVTEAAGSASTIDSIFGN